MSNMTLTPPLVETDSEYLSVQPDTKLADRLGQEAQRAADVADRLDAPREVECNGTSIAIGFDERQLLHQAKAAPLSFAVPETGEEYMCAWLVVQGLMEKDGDSYQLTEAGAAMVAAEEEELDRGEHLPDFTSIAANAASSANVIGADGFTQI